MSFLKKLIRKPAIYVVTLWANLVYKQGVYAAEARHKAERKTIYLACETFRQDKLTTYNRAEFRAYKHLFGVHARLLTMNTLRRGSYYYTSDQNGANALPEKERERRRRAFIDERLRLARLV